MHTRAAWHTAPTAYTLMHQMLYTGPLRCSMLHILLQCPAKLAPACVQSPATVCTPSPCARIANASELHAPAPDCHARPTPQSRGLQHSVQVTVLLPRREPQCTGAQHLLRPQPLRVRWCQGLLPLWLLPGPGKGLQPAAIHQPAATKPPASTTPHP